MDNGWNLLKKPVAAAASTLIAGVGDVLDTLITTKEDREKLRQAEIKLLQDYNATMESIYLTDVQSARQLQIEALRQDDKFTRRFVYYLSIGLVGAAILFNFSLLLIDFPSDNRDMINMALGTLNSLGFASVVTFFLGSSKASAQKNDTITSLSNLR